MNKLVKRAMLGDRKAQEEITARGKLLPCPFCGSEKLIHKGAGTLDWITCGVCSHEGAVLSNAEESTKDWNTRPKLVTFCSECNNYYKRKCWAYDEFVSVSPDGFCSRGERKDNNEKV